MSSKLTFESAQPEHAALLTQTAIKSKANWGYPAHWMALWEADLTVSESYITRHEVKLILADAHFVGFYALIYNDDDAPELDHLWLLPEAQGKGYGRQLMQHIKQDLSLQSFANFTLVAEPHAHGFYEKMGGRFYKRFESKIAGRFLEIFLFETSWNTL